jgi:hypothetical protein
MKLSMIRLRAKIKARGHKILSFVFPIKTHYLVLCWRRINPKHQFTGGEFHGVNDWQLVHMSFCRFHLTAIFIEALLGPKYFFEVKHQFCQIIEKGDVAKYKRIFGLIKRPSFINSDYELYDIPAWSAPKPLIKTAAPEWEYPPRDYSEDDN